MDFESFFQSLLSLLKSGDNVYCVLYALATCLLTQIFKKIFVSKVKVDVLHRFDVAVILPFVFGLGCAVFDLTVVQSLPFSLDFVVKLVVTATTVGALSSVMFKLVSSLSGQSLKSLLKNDLFGVFYTQLLYFGTVRTQLVDGKMSLNDFLSQVKLLSANAVGIYQGDDTAEVKKSKLHRLLDGVVDSQSIASCVEILNSALIAVTESNQAPSPKTD